MAVVESIAPRASRWPDASAQQWLSFGLVTTAAAEFLLLRLFTRTAIHIPGIAQLSGPYTALAESGRYAYYVGTVFLVVLLIALAAALLRHGTFHGVAGAAGLFAFIIGAAGSRAGVVDDTTLAVISVSAVVALSIWAARALSRPAGVVVVLFAAAFVLAAIFAIAQSVWPSGPPVLRDSSLLVAAEALALFFAVASPLLAPRRNDRWALVAAGAMGVAIFAALTGTPATVKILALWSFGLAGYFPAVLYALGAGAVTYSLVAMFRAGHLAEAAGLTLLVLGGIGLQSTYQTGLGIVGLAVIGQAVGLKTPSASRASPPVGVMEASEDRPRFELASLRWHHHPAGPIRHGTVQRTMRARSRCSSRRTR
ncbi:MAG: hypothetical protein V3V06_02660, partial [Dehalococcoidia bacterium]